MNCTDKGLNRALQLLNQDPIKQTIQLLELKKVRILNNIVDLEYPVCVLVFTFRVYECVAKNISIVVDSLTASRLQEQSQNYRWMRKESFELTT